MATPTIHLDATVNPDGWIAGTLYSDDATLAFINPLESLGTPANDRDFRRTYPGRYDPGSLTFGPTGDGGWWFTTRLPRRYGDFGVTRHGLFANGGWYPQPLSNGDPVNATWLVQLNAPSEGQLVLGDTTGTGTLKWSGSGQRVSLALLPNATRHPLTAGDHSLTIAFSGQPKAAVRYLTRHWATLGAAVPSEHTAVVIAPLRRRIARSGEGVTYLSDRAFRLTPGFKGLHRRATVQGLIESQLSLSSPQLEAFVAATLATAFERQQRESVAKGILKYGRWNPVVHSLLYSGTMPFYSETLGRVHPSDPLQDDLLERLAPHTPGAVLAAQVTARTSHAQTEELATALANGKPEADELRRRPEIADMLQSWTMPYPEQDYRIDVREGEAPLHITRDAPPDAPAETILIRINGQNHPWTTSRGADIYPLPENPKRIRVDPNQVTRQTSTENDGWPTPWTLTTAASLTTLNLRRGYLEGFVSGWFRRANTHRNIPSIMLSTSRENWLDARVGFLHQFGPQLTGTLRAQRVLFTARTSLLNPNFAEITDGNLTAEVGAAWRWDTRNDLIFPRKGKALSASLGLGFMPGSNQRWWSLLSSATTLISPHPRHVIATRASLAYADSDVPHRILDMGGPFALRSLPPATYLVNARAVGRVEYRATLLRDLSIPLLTFWGSELQVTSGLECGVGATVDQVSTVCGATAGLAGVLDLLGGIPQMMGVTAGWPIASNGLSVPRSALPEIYLRWWQEF